MAGLKILWDILCKKILLLLGTYFQTLILFFILEEKRGAFLFLNGTSPSCNAKRYNTSSIFHTSHAH